MAGKVKIAQNVFQWLGVKEDIVQTILILVAVNLIGKELYAMNLFASKFYECEKILLLI